MRLAEDLSGFIGRFGIQLADAAAERLKPLFNPATEKLPDLSVIERLRTSRHPTCIRTGKAFHFYPPQLERIAGAVAALKHQRTAWMIEEMACGKTAQAIAAAWLKLKHKPDYRILVMCPGHLVKKWAREVTWLLPNADCRVIMNFADLKKFQADAANPINPRRSHLRGVKNLRPMVAVIGKDTAKLGVELCRPTAAGRKMRIVSSDRTTGKEVITDITMAVCPKCGAMLMQKGKDGADDTPCPLSAYQSQDNPERCEECGDVLWTNYREPGRYPKPHLDRYIQRHMKGVFDMLIADEVHELASADSAQGNAFGTLGAACKYVLALTGTLIGGKAHDLHAPLWRMAPALVRQRGFTLHRSLTSKRSAVGRNERNFIRRYGVMEQRVTRAVDGDAGGRVTYGNRSRRKQCKSEERPKPGISPDLFNHFLLGNAVFMSLSELGEALPSLERELVPVKASDELAEAYRFIDNAFTDAMKDEAFRGKGPPMLAMLRVQVLDAYLDKPWDWKPVTAAIYQDGVKAGTKVVVVPPDLGELREDAKDRKLLEIVQRELAAGRKCAIYPAFTGRHDVRPKLLAMLRRAGIRVTALPDKVDAIDREAWIEKHASEMDVLIAHPKRVQTGLDLIQFPSIVWYQTGYSTHTLRQASARARRPTQTQACKVIYLYYQGTVQESCMSLMGEKTAASEMLEGLFDTESLRAMMNGCDNDDILAALANSLDKKLTSAKAAWQKLTQKTVEHGGEFVFDFEEATIWQEDTIFS